MTSRIKDKVLAALTECGPMTSRELAEEIGLGAETVRARITELRREKLLRIKAWRRTSEGSRLYPRAVWTTEPGPDAVKPKPQKPVETSKRYRNRKKTAVNSVFMLGVKLRDRKPPPLLKKVA